MLAAARPGPGGPEVIDVAVDKGAGLVGALSVPNLFGGRRVVAADNLEAMDEESASQLAAIGKASSCVVVARCSGPLRPKLKKVLGTLGDIVVLSTPKGRAVTARVDQLARASGVRLGQQQRALLVETASGDLARVAGALEQLASVGATDPSVAQVSTLLGTAQGSSAPWDVTDALESGDLQSALAAADKVEPIALMAYVQARAVQLGRLIEAGVRSPDDAVKLLGLSHRFQAERLVALAERLGEDGKTSIWAVLQGADRAVRHARDQRAALDIVLIKLSRAYARPTRPSTR